MLTFWSRFHGAPIPSSLAPPSCLCVGPAEWGHQVGGVPPPIVSSLVLVRSSLLLSVQQVDLGLPRRTELNGKYIVHVCSTCTVCDIHMICTCQSKHLKSTTQNAECRFSLKMRDVLLCLSVSESFQPQEYKEYRHCGFNLLAMQTAKYKVRV